MTEEQRRYFVIEIPILTPKGLATISFDVRKYGYRDTAAFKKAPRADLRAIIDQEKADSA